MFTRIQKQSNALRCGALEQSDTRLLRLSRGFTLIELLMVVMIIGVLASFVMVALAGVNQSAKEDRTTVQIMKINELLMDKWQSYQYRRMPPANLRLATYKLNWDHVKFKNWLDSNGGYGLLAADRLTATREMMRLELPSTKDEIVGPNEAGKSHLVDPLNPSKRKPLVPALSRAYYQRAKASVQDGDLRLWTTTYESAECLYLILSQLRESDASALEFFSEKEIGDADGDGMNEILDSWGRPILFLRWAPGFFSTLQVPLAQDAEQEDMFDPMQVGLSYTFPPDSIRPRALFPLIFSAGPDQEYGTRTGGDWFVVNSDPYHESMKWVGGPTDGVVGQAAMDNITNHLLSTR